MSSDELQNTNLNDSELLACKNYDMTFTRNDNLQRHLKVCCKSKKHFDELENLKEKIKIIEKEKEQVIIYITFYNRFFIITIVKKLKIIKNI